MNLRGDWKFGAFGRELLGNAAKPRKAGIPSFVATDVAVQERPLSGEPSVYRIIGAKVEELGVQL